MNESLYKAWVLVIEVPPDSRDMHSYTVCGFNTRILALRQRKRLEQLRQRYERGRIEADDEISMPDGNILFPTQIGTMHLFQRIEEQP